MEQLWRKDEFNMYFSSEIFNLKKPGDISEYIPELRKGR
jgi:hypothetical protein